MERCQLANYSTRFCAVGVVIAFVHHYTSHMETQTITLELPRGIVERIQHMASLLETPVDDLFAQTMSSSLPDLRDVPTDMQTELARMTWLSDTHLWQIANSSMSEDDQRKLQHFAKQVTLTDKEINQLETLRREYGRVTLRKARAYALLSLRGGKPLLA